MKKLSLLIITLLVFSALKAQEMNEPLRIIAIGAHPDDCDSKLGGTAALFAEVGHEVKFVSLTNGDAGHQSEGGGALAKRRIAEAKAAGEALGIEYEVLDNHDAELQPTLKVRHEVIRRIRDWNADIVLCHRTNDYHPDHRNGGLIVQDAAYLVIVPNVTPDTPPLEKNPVFLYMQDRFQKPYPFQRDIAVIIDKTVDKKARALAAHDSQMFEWLPWTRGVDPSTIPSGKAERLEWLKEDRMKPKDNWSEEEIAAVTKWYPDVNPKKEVDYVEYFEICEYGRQPSDEGIRSMFPMLGVNNR